MPASELKTRESIASELLGNFRNLAERANSLAQRVEGKLQPVMRNQEAQCTAEAGAPEECYPPLLDEYRSVMYQIQNSFCTIEDCLNRTEI